MGGIVPADDLPSNIVPAHDLPEVAAPVGPLNKILEPGRSLFSRITEPLPHSFGSGIPSAAYNAGGTVTDLTGSPLAGYATNVGMQALPMAAGGGLGKMASPAMESGAQLLMKSAVKPSLADWKAGKAQPAIDTLLNEGINPTQGGMETIHGRVSDLNAKIAELIKNSNATVDKGNIASRTQEVLARYMKQANPQADQAAIERVTNDFLSHPELAGQSSMPVQLAQELKRGTQRAIGDKGYGMGLKPAAERDSLKALARGMKEDIATAAPEVTPLNAKESELLNVLSVAERRAFMDANKNPLSLAVLAHNPATFAIYLADKSALFKSLMARMLHSGSEQIPATAGRLAGAIVGAQSGSAPNQPQGQ